MDIVIIEGMGYYCDSSQKGMNVHSCIAVTESGIVLGMVHQESHTREKQKSSTKKGYQTKSKAIEEKENFRWINTARTVQQQISAVDTDMDCLLVCDKEGDFYELFAECVKLKLPLLVRATQNRSLKETVQKEGKILVALKANGTFWNNGSESKQKSCKKGAGKDCCYGVPVW